MANPLASCESRSPVTLKDGILLLIAIGWAGTSFAAVIAYGIAKIPKGSPGPSIAAFVCGTASLVLAFDYWKFHRARSFAILEGERSQEQKHFVKKKMFFVLFMTVLFAVATAIFAAFQSLFDPSDPIWTGLTSATLFVWFCDLYFLHFRPKPSAPETEYDLESRSASAHSELSSDDEAGRQAALALDSSGDD